MTKRNETHSVLGGYVLWLFGFTGAHRFYYGRPITGLLWLFTGGLFLVGWVVDLFLMPSLARSAEDRYSPGRYDYTVAWVLLTYFGPLGLHRFYLGYWRSGLLYLVTGGLLGVGWIYDFVQMNEMVDGANRSPPNGE